MGSDGEMKKITNLEMLSKHVGKTHGPRDLKVIDFLDGYAIKWLQYAACAFISSVDDVSCGPQITIAGGQRGFISANRSSFSILKDAIDDTTMLCDGMTFGALVLVSGHNETLRVNGVITLTEEKSITFVVKECFLHCSKALIRAEFWSSQHDPLRSQSMKTTIQGARFMVLASCNDNGRVDVSPRGDPQGKLFYIDSDKLWFADRPGNRRVDSFTNIVTQPKVALLVLTYGSNDVVYINGEAQLIGGNTNETLTVAGKTPSLTVSVSLKRQRLVISRALGCAAPWTTSPPPESFKGADIFKRHIQLNKDKSVAAKIARAAVSLPGVLSYELEKDYKNNLF